MKSLIIILICLMVFMGCVFSKNYNKDSQGMFMPSAAYFERGADAHVDSEIAELN